MLMASNSGSSQLMECPSVYRGVQLLLVSRSPRCQLRGNATGRTVTPIGSQPLRRIRLRFERPQRSTAVRPINAPFDSCAALSTAVSSAICELRVGAIFEVAVEPVG